MNGKPWTSEENEILKLHYPNMVSVDICKYLPNRTMAALRSQANKLGVLKSKELLSSLAEPLKVSGAAHRYPKGSIPANKGKVMDDALKEKYKHTFFQKGNQPHNTKPIGTISERKDMYGWAYKHIKIADSDWRLLHREVWIEHNGPIPPGHRIHFKDKNTLNCEIENLECLSPQQAMDLNRITDLPVELQEVIKLKNKLTNKIKSHGTK